MNPIKFFLLSLKRIIQNNSSFYIENMIWYILRKDFRIHHKTNLNNLSDYVLKMKKKPKNEIIKVVFMCQMPSIWNSNMSTFMAAEKNKKMDVYILAIPDKLFEENNGENVFYEENESYNYCSRFCVNTINAYNKESKKWFDLENIRPDYVFVQRPYDGYLPLQYRSEALAAYTKVCYIPYAYNMMNYATRLTYDLDFSDKLYLIFTENQKNCNELNAIYSKLFGVNWKQIKFFGYPRFDLHVGVKKEKTIYKKTVLWLPRWTTNRFVEATTFFKFKDILIDYFKKHQEICFICRPHPLMFKNFISTGEMLEQEVERFKGIFREMSNFYLDESPNYVKTMTEADIFISDTSSLLVEEFITSNPIIFCGVKRHFNKENMGWAKYMYSVSNKRELLEQLERLINEEDPLIEERKQYIKEHLKADGLAGERIVRFLIEDYQKN